MKKKLIVVLLACALLSSCGVHVKNADSEVSVGKDGIIVKGKDGNVNVDSNGVKVENKDNDINVDSDGVKVESKAYKIDDDEATKERRKNNDFITKEEILKKELKEGGIEKKDISDLEIKLDKKEQTYTLKYKSFNQKNTSVRDAINGKIIKKIVAPMR